MELQDGAKFNRMDRLKSGSLPSAPESFRLFIGSAADKESLLVFYDFQNDYVSEFA